MKTPAYSPLIQHWQLDRTVTYLNHGSFGACPIPVLKKQDEYRNQLERAPVKFMIRELEDLIWQSKEVLANFIHARAEDLVFVPNATTGVNVVLNSLSFQEGDELLTTDHGYDGCLNALKYFAAKSKAKMVVAQVPYPIKSSDEVVDALLSMVTEKTKLVMVDHITSATGIIFPVEKIVTALQERNIDCLIDGAHVAGHIDLDVEKIGAAYYTGNCHKWICSPKGAAFLHVRKDKQHEIHPLSYSHLYDRPIPKEKYWSSHFFWPGTNDYSAYLCVKDTLEFMGSLFPGGWSELKQHNRDLCLQARKIISERTKTPLPAPEEMIGNLSDIYIKPATLPEYGFNYIHPLQDQLWNDYKIEVPVMIWNKEDPRLWVRISAQCYNSLEQYEYLGKALVEIL